MRVIITCFTPDYLIGGNKFIAFCGWYGNFAETGFMFCSWLSKSWNWSAEGIFFVLEFYLRLLLILLGLLVSAGNPVL